MEDWMEWRREGGHGLLGGNKSIFYPSNSVILARRSLRFFSIALIILCSSSDDEDSLSYSSDRMGGEPDRLPAMIYYLFIFPFSLPEYPLDFLFEALALRCQRWKRGLGETEKGGYIVKWIGELHMRMKGNASHLEMRERERERLHFQRCEIE